LAVKTRESLKFDPVPITVKFIIVHTVLVVPVPVIPRPEVRETEFHNTSIRLDPLEIPGRGE
jgi:hypothetical protein